MKRKADIYALLRQCKHDLGDIERKYQHSLNRGAVGPSLQVDIKNYCGNLRSILDYIAHDIRQTCCPKPTCQARLYFPILDDEDTFAERVQKWYPGLKRTAPTLWSYLESVQPYHNGYQWIGQLNRINNENKHRNLVPQTRTETRRTRVTFPGGNVTWNRASVTYGPGVSIGGVPVDPTTQLPAPHPSQQVERIVCVDFRFQGEDVSAVRLLRQSLEGIRKIAQDIEGLLSAGDCPK